MTELDRRDYALRAAARARPQPAPLTFREAETLAFLNEYLDEHGWAPTVREIATGVGVASTSTVASFLDGLEAKGRIERPTPGSAIQGRSRAIRVVGR